ncbi:DUF2336 domain-containing protein [Bradyrhizobium sp. 83012]|uniref:DUF2336 domain-containing protein n=1 Tax=Bradyrhizobium aeschynomenes TaxID=2734909 RepID=A0ABX2CFU9_9BRAD|nr:DUF2336 domain-containing protein [Bradyrhizobium aeschynomenes]NPU10513.1 DUF2336 domain-containing protein [Bradyrhizobium aeschynomenes]NPU67061.1 DUF2336 domain-containing protein [Bradyrhizobium aeschynomenes]NPV19830.1 DUF2336 domain-containing protein [Bradyrhizobium aeschynomenes]
MTRSSLFPGFDGLLTLSRREGVDIKPTLLRVLTDLYVQASTHSADEERQFVELVSRLVDDVDDTTRAAVRARLAIYPGTPIEILNKLGLRPAQDAPMPPLAGLIPPALRSPSAKAPARDDSAIVGLAMQPKDAAELAEMFLRAGAKERIAILQNLATAPLKPAAPTPQHRAAQAIEALEMAAFNADAETFTIEIGESLILPARITQDVMNDESGELLACAAKALGMPAPVFERVLLFLKPEMGQSVHTVFRLSRFYERLSERAALIMLAAWRGSAMAAIRAKHRTALYDDERQHVRGSTARVGTPGSSKPIVRTGTDGFKR